MSAHVIGLSGGKDSTALALRLAEVEPRDDYVYLCTPTGDELPVMEAHWTKLEGILGKPIVRLRNRTLDAWIDHFDALPNWRQRWCTRLLKIEPTLAYLSKLEDPILYVGLRADEEARQDIYSEQVTTRFPLREWDWGLEDVVGYLKDKGIKIPERTDCARCYGQRLSDWYKLWVRHPELYEDAVQQEERIGATFRSPRRDTWPAQLVQLRRRFADGDTPRGIPKDGILPDEEEEDAADSCRVCRL